MSSCAKPRPTAPFVPPTTTKTSSASFTGCSSSWSLKSAISSFRPAPPASAVDSFDTLGGIHQEIELVATYFIIVLQAAVGCLEEIAHTLDGAFAAGSHELQDAGIFRSEEHTSELQSL